MFNLLLISLLLIERTSGLGCYFGNLHRHSEVSGFQIFNQTVPAHFACIRYDTVFNYTGAGERVESSLGAIAECTPEKLDEVCRYLTKGSTSAFREVKSCEAKCCITDLCNGNILPDIEAYLVQTATDSSTRSLSYTQSANDDVIISTVTELSSRQTTNGDVTMVTTDKKPFTQSTSSDNTINTNTHITSKQTASCDVTTRTALYPKQPTSNDVTMGTKTFLSETISDVAVKKPAHKSSIIVVFAIIASILILISVCLICVRHLLRHNPQRIRH